MKNKFFKKDGGHLIWITGLPGSGKTTLAKKVYELVNDFTPTVCIDGDAIREIMGNDLGYRNEDRKKNAYRLAKLNKYLVEHDLTVVCSTVSLIKEIHEWNRKNIDNLMEVYIDVSMNILIKRDKKNIYTKGLKGEMEYAIGVNQSYEIPEKPHMTIKNNGSIKLFLANANKIRDIILK